MTRRCFVCIALLLQALGASAIERLVLSHTGNTSVLSSGQTLVPLELSSAALTDLLTKPQDLSPVTLDSYVTGGEWTLNNWSKPLSEMLSGTSATDQTVQVDLQLFDAMDVAVSQLLVQADSTSLDSVDLSLVFGADALADLSGLVQVHVDGMKTSFQDQWLPAGVDLNQLIFDKATVDTLELGKTVTIQQVVIRNSNLSFPTAVLGLTPAVTTLILEHNTISGPIELTADEFAQLSNITDFRATGNGVDASASGSSSCVKEETFGELSICIVNDDTSATSVQSGSTDSSSSNAQATGSLETQSASSSNSSHGALSITAIVLACACTVIIVVVLSIFRKFKRKASKFVDERLTFTNREDDLLGGRRSEGRTTEDRRSETESELRPSGNERILADMDLGKDQVIMHKKLGIQGLWLGEYQDTKVVALKFLPRELTMDIEGLNAVRLSYAPLRHDNIVTFLGSSWTDREEVLIVVEHMAKGSLKAVLADEKVELPWSQRLQMSKEVCLGLDFIRSIQGSFLSQNLTTRSVLVDAQLTCKLDIFDYALSLRKDLVPVRSFGNGDIANRAPELLKGEEITAAAEIYALGVIFCEISSRSKLYEQVAEERGQTMADIFIATEVVAQRLKPSPAEDAPANFREWTLRCLAYEPSERPTISEVLSMISK
ncbi:Dual specificity protein kinase shkA [Phytophthora citrophthora]|uniref:Dual specificity protein kinase shkA n=1 Tax=Phytophthora citrophthora TaxID=4793 RepID=A0AAD9G5Z8_9STRA|nr:Dual specificity protein kinase shkA [Phytophthora citrophthora]